MQPDARAFLYDIQQATDLAAEFTRDRQFSGYERDAMLRPAVERQFEIAGEALARLARYDEDLAARVTEYRRIIAFRNILHPRLRTGR